MPATPVANLTATDVITAMATMERNPILTKDPETTPAITPAMLTTPVANLTATNVITAMATTATMATTPAMPIIPAAKLTATGVITATAMAIMVKMAAPPAMSLTASIVIKVMRAAVKATNHLYKDRRQ